MHAQGALVGTPEALRSKLEQLGGRVVCERIASPLGRSRAGLVLIVWPDGACDLQFDDDAAIVSVSCVCADRALVQQIAAVVREHLTLRSRSGRAYVLTRGRGGPELTQLGVAAIPLERANYEPQVLEALDHVVADLASPTPCGRLTIIEGVPGSGKTFAMRGILAAQRGDAMFVVVPPDLVHELAKPELVTALLRQKHEDFDGEGVGPIVLVLEDADECLAPRMADNIGSVATMLAFGDGIIGSVIDVRILATTNRKRLEMDSALLRPGRLCRQISIGPVSPEHARVVFTRLTGREPGGVRLDRAATIAEVYAAARDAGWQPTPEAPPVRTSVERSMLRLHERVGFVLD